MEEEFKDIKETQGNNQENSEANIIVRAPLPRENQMIGTIDQRLGGNRMHITCSDGKTRNCRVPGRLKRRLWLRPGDVVMIELWELDKDKGDIILKYKPNQVTWLKKKGHLTTEADEF